MVIEEKFIELQLIKSPESEKFLRGLIEKKIITKETMRNYIIVHLFDEYMRCNKSNITEALIDLEIDFNISSRHIRRILSSNRPFC